MKRSPWISWRNGSWLSFAEFERVALVNKITPTEFKLLRDYIEEVCGISLGEEKNYLIETRFSSLMEEKKFSTFHDLYKYITHHSTRQLRDRIIDAITTKETLWFRDTHPFTIVEEIILPSLTQRIRAGEKTKIRIWSAACSTGQEPYSIAMMVEEFCRNRPFLKPDHFEILATDVSLSAIETAEGGRYNSVSIQRGLSEEKRDRYFFQTGNLWELNDSIKQRVSFRKFNLLDSFAHLGKFDVVFLRYVTIYFSNSLKNTIIDKCQKVLSPSGYLLLGASESLFDCGVTFECMSHSGGMYFINDKR